MPLRNDRPSAASGGDVGRASSLVELWERARVTHGPRTAVISGGRAHSYEALGRMVDALAGALAAEFGVGRGSRVALLLPNCLEFIIAYFALLKTGATALPINIRLKPQEAEHIVKDAGPSLLVAHRDTWDLAGDLLGNLGSALDLVLVDAAAPGARCFQELLQPSDHPIPSVRPDPDDVAAIIYTSGTTGLPKGAMLTHRNVLFNTDSCIAAHGFVPEDRHLLIVPLFHVTGLNTILPTSIRLGSTVIVSSRTTPKEIIASVDTHRATTVFGVPTTYILLTQAKALQEARFRSVRLIAYSGAPMPVDVIRRLRERFPRAALHNFYGLTECTSIATVLPSAQALERNASIGRAVPGVELKILSEAGQALGPGEIGELLMHGDNVFPGYLNNTEATARTVVDGWLHTGDLARMDAEGYVYLEGRKTEMIIVAGENVYPIEVERALCEHEAVLEAAVVGRPHPVLGEAVVAVIALRADAEATAQEIKRHCSARLAGYKVPHVVEFVKALPRNPSGKVVKGQLR